MVQDYPELLIFLLLSYYAAAACVIFVLFLHEMVQEHAWFCSSRFVELIDFLLGFKPSTDITTLRSRLACFHPLMVHLLKVRPLLLFCLIQTYSLFYYY